MRDITHRYRLLTPHFFGTGLSAMCNVATTRTPTVLVFPYRSKVHGAAHVRDRVSRVASRLEWSRWATPRQRAHGTG